MSINTRMRSRLVAARRPWLFASMLAAFLAGCATGPAERSDAAWGASPAVAETTYRDGRARFRQIFCDVADRRARREEDCAALLWQLADEPAPPPDPGARPRIARDLRFLVVSGAFSDCLDPPTVPFESGIRRLASRGVRIAPLMVSGRSSAEHNAGEIAAALASAAPARGERIVLIGYSKGSVDILEFLVRYPELAAPVAAVVSVAGPIHGSPLADKAASLYQRLFAHAFRERCDPGDGGVLESLRPGLRQRWLAEHALPAGVEYFSVAAFPSRDRLSRGLRYPWGVLAKIDARNDGQVVAQDALIPGATLLGYLDADHWDLAIALEKQHPHLGAHRDPRRFPRDVLLEALLRQVSETLGRGNAQGTPGVTRESRPLPASIGSVESFQPRLRTPSGGTGTREILTTRRMPSVK